MCTVGTPDEVVNWEARLSERQEFGTEHGIVVIYDLGRRPLLGQLLDEDLILADRLMEEFAETGSAALRGNDSENLATIIKCCGGVGTHRVWRGVDASAPPFCLLTDIGATSNFELVDTSNPWSRRRPGDSQILRFVGRFGVSWTAGGRGGLDRLCAHPLQQAAPPCLALRALIATLSCGRVRVRACRCDPDSAPSSLVAPQKAGLAS